MKKNTTEDKMGSIIRNSSFADSTQERKFFDTGSFFPGNSYANASTKKQSVSNKPAAHSATSVASQNQNNFTELKKDGLFHFPVSSEKIIEADRINITRLSASWHNQQFKKSILIEGFASVDGAADFNKQLSLNRALAVRNKLLEEKIPGRFIIVEAKGETTQFSKTNPIENRVATASFVPAPTPVVIPCNTLPRNILIDNAGCAAGPDFTSNDNLPLPPLNAASKMDALPDFALAAAPRSFLATLAQSDGLNLFNGFFNSSMQKKDFIIGSEVSNLTKADPSYTAAISNIFQQLAAEIATQFNSGVIDCNSLRIPHRPPINLSNSSMKLHALVGGTQGLVVVLNSLSIDPVSKNFQAQLGFIICDDFGVDITDLQRTGTQGTFLNQLLLPFWILQHRRSGHTPVLVNILTDESHAGQF